MVAFAGAVLCGGESRRMGRDKALVEVGGLALARRVAAALTAAGADPVVAVGGDAEALGALGLEAVVDRWPGAGPLGALVHALDDVGDDGIVVVLACDLVQPDAAAIVAMAQRLEASSADAIVPVVDGRRQWLHAAWRRRVRGVLRDAFEAGERSLHGATTGLRIDFDESIPAAAVADADVPGELPSP